MASTCANLDLESATDNVFGWIQGHVCQDIAGWMVSGRTCDSRDIFLALGVKDGGRGACWGVKRTGFTTPGVFPHGSFHSAVK